MSKDYVYKGSRQSLPPSGGNLLVATLLKSAQPYPLRMPGTQIRTDTCEVDRPRVQAAAVARASSSSGVATEPIIAPYRARTIAGAVGGQ